MKANDGMRLKMLKTLFEHFYLLFLLLPNQPFVSNVPFYCIIRLNLMSTLQGSREVSGIV